MNVWKPLAIVAISAFAISTGYSLSSGRSVISENVAEAEGPCHDQPHMAEAKEHFRQARAALDHAEHNKGGWRDRAIEAADKAIRETNAGCEFADHH